MNNENPMLRTSFRGPLDYDLHKEGNYVRCSRVLMRIEELIELHSPEDVLEILKGELS